MIQKFMQLMEEDAKMSAKKNFRSFLYQSKRTKPTKSKKKKKR